MDHPARSDRACNHQQLDRAEKLTPSINQPELRLRAISIVDGDPQAIHACQVLHAAVASTSAAAMPELAWMQQSVDASLLKTTWPERPSPDSHYLYNLPKRTKWSRARCSARGSGRSFLIWPSA